MNRYSKLTGDALSEHLSNYLVSSWSYSAVSTFCRNEKAYEMQYIYGERERRSLTAIVGNAYHYALEAYFSAWNEGKQESVDLMEKALAYLDGIPSYDWKLTTKFPTIEASKEEAAKTVAFLLESFASELDTYTHGIQRILSVEEKQEAWVTLCGHDIPLPLHFIIDIVAETTEGKIVIIDHKSKARFLEDGDIFLTYGKQATTYTIGWEALNPGHKVSEVWFIENKTSRNKDKSPQIRKHVIEMTPERRWYYENFLNIAVSRLVKAVSDPDYIYLVNDSDMLSDAASLYEFTLKTISSEVCDFDNIPADKKDLVGRHQEAVRKASAVAAPKVIGSFRRQARSFVEDLNTEMPVKVKPSFIAVKQYDLEGTFIASWSSATTASKTLGLDRSSITKVCRHKRASCGGFIWKY